MTFVTLSLLILAASAGSWLLSQWSGARQHPSGAMIVAGGMGVALLIMAVTLLAINTPLWWQSLLPEQFVAHIRKIAEDDSLDRNSSPSTLSNIDSKPALEPHGRAASLLQSAEQAIRDKDLSAALACLQQADSAEDLSAREDYLLASMLAYVHVKLQNHAAAVAALERELRWPELTSDQRALLARDIARLLFQIKHYGRTVLFAKQYLDQHPQDAETRALLATALYMTEHYFEAAEQIDHAVATNHQLGRDIPVNWLQLRLQAEAHRSNGIARQLQQQYVQNYPQHAELWKNSIALPPAAPAGAPANTVSTGSITHGGSSSVDPLSRDWPLTECVESKRQTDMDRWLLDNECEHAVAVVLAWCERNNPCAEQVRNGAGWRYEPAGIVMTSMKQRPSLHRLTHDGPLLAPIYVLDKANSVDRIRYLACEVTGSEILALLKNPKDYASLEEREAALDTALEKDNCYSRVQLWSRIGRQTGKSPDELLHEGVAM